MTSSIRHASVALGLAASLLLMAASVLTWPSAALAASSIGFNPSSGAVGTSVQLTAHMDEPPDAQVGLILLHEDATANDDPRQIQLGEVVFDASGDAVVTFTVPDIEPGRYVTSWGCASCTAAFPDGEFQVTAGALPNTALDQPLGPDGGAWGSLLLVGLLLLGGAVYRGRRSRMQSS